MKNKKILGAIALSLSVFACTTSFFGCAKKPSGEKEAEKGRIFDEPELSRFYNYASSVMVDGDDVHIWYCSNPSSGASGDHIFYRKGTIYEGKRYWGEKTLVLSPGEAGEWDGANVCDPSVIKGEFRYKQTDYAYLMAYLGCKTYGNYENSFGFAVANKPEGPWIKVTTPEISPVYDFYSLYPGGGDNMQLWGTGQPSLVSSDKKGKVLVFYTKHFDPDWGEMAERWDLSDLDTPSREFSVKLEADGLTQRNSSQTDYITNADFAYDPDRNVLFTGTDVHPFGPDYPNNIPTVARVAYAHMTSEAAGVVGGSLKSGLYWNDIEQLSEDKTGNKRHSNLSFVRDPYGWTSGNAIDVIYASSDVKEEEDWALIYTWRLYGYTVNLNKQ